MPYTFNIERGVNECGYDIYVGNDKVDYIVAKDYEEAQIRAKEKRGPNATATLIPLGF